MTKMGADNDCDNDYDKDAKTTSTVFPHDTRHAKLPN